MAELPEDVEIILNMATNNTPSTRSESAIREICRGYDVLASRYLEVLGTNEELRALLAETILKMPLVEAQQMLEDTKAHSEQNKELITKIENQNDERDKLRKIIEDTANLLEIYSMEEAKKLRDSLG